MAQQGAWSACDHSRHPPAGRAQPLMPDRIGAAEDRKPKAAANPVMDRVLAIAEPQYLPPADHAVLLRCDFRRPPPPSLSFAAHFAVNVEFGAHGAGGWWPSPRA